MLNLIRMKRHKESIVFFFLIGVLSACGQTKQKSQQKPAMTDTKITTIDKEYGSYRCDCPICERFLSINCKAYETKFCPECGQVIDWSEDE